MTAGDRLGGCWLLPLVILLVLVASPARADVEPDCFEGKDAVICAAGRLADAQAAYKLLRPVMQQAGWESTLYGVQYIGGDKGGADAFFLRLRGPKGAKAASIANSGSADDVRMVGALVTKALASAPSALRAQLLRHVDECRVTNGHGDVVQLAVVDLQVQSATTGVGGIGAKERGGPSSHGTSDDPKMKVVGTNSKEATVEGSPYQGLIRQVIRRNIGQVRDCFETARKAEPSLAGDLVVSFTIAPSGEVQSGRVVERSTLSDAKLEACVVERVRSWVFPSTKGAPVIVTYPFRFKNLSD